jgi:hypothetical protein
MSSTSVNPVRRQILLVGAGALALPLSAWATPDIGVSVLGSPANPMRVAPLTPNAMPGFAEQGEAFGEGQRLILSGRLTDQQGEAITGAVVELALENVSTLSDADGRFMMIATVPVGQMLALRVTTPEGQTQRKYLRLRDSAAALSMPAHLDALLADCRYEGERVWRSNFSVRLTA